MAEFADRMKSFTDHLRDSIHERCESLKGIHEATGELLDDARDFLGHVAEEHRERAAELRTTLEEHRAGCRERVAEMRQGHQEALQAMRDELNHTLSEARQMRQDTTGRMFETFRQARHELASDLSSAAATWREFAASQAAARGASCATGSDRTDDPDAPDAPKASPRTGRGHKARHRHAAGTHRKSARS
jgi:chromosome segregation ATPase